MVKFKVIYGSEVFLIAPLPDYLPSTSALMPTLMPSLKTLPNRYGQKTGD